ncbi:MAG: endolytic transglycosylase MltG [Parcubacteria group bacterium]|nr:endolytic transglycosylase MltG [Parcubacteria group bacterium]
MNRDIYSTHKRRSSLSRPALMVLFGIAVIFVFLSIVYVNSQFSSISDAGDESDIYFVVKSGDNLGDIAKNLEEQGLISKKLYFNLYVRFKDSKDGIKADLYKLSPSLTIKEIAGVLLSGESTEDNEITIIEGWTINQVATKYAEFKRDFGRSGKSQEELENEFMQAVNKASDYDYAFLKDAPENATLEGFLFPDTYELYQDAMPKDLIDKMLVNFDNKLDDELIKGIEERDENIFEIITLASIVQREVQTEEDMKGVAGVYFNRLYIGRNLESDVTVNYVTGKNDPTPSYADTDAESLYNTYQNEGLPPGPVANPGIMAIRATINPTDHDFYYFLTRLDTGEALFSTRGYEHEAKKEKYLK